MADLPQRVTIVEEGPREGFQTGPMVPTAEKVRLIEALAATGLGQIVCASFVDRRFVPQMADAEAVAAAIRRRAGPRYVSLWLNDKGFERARAMPLDLAPMILGIVSDSMARKNNGCDAATLVRKQGRLLALYREHGLPLEAAHVSTAFGCHFEGLIGPEATLATVAALFDICRDHALMPAIVYFSDTVGAATPKAVTELLLRARGRWPEQEFGLHLHDTRGMGLACAYAGLQLGVTRFDASIGGLGGCPFSGNIGAAGNVCTEDLALMCEEMGVDTGLDLEALAECARMAEAIAGRTLPGRFMRVQRLARKAS
jgi:hydroxymethylglutaryl-CoA lyase